MNNIQRYISTYLYFDLCRHQNMTHCLTDDFPVDILMTVVAVTVGLISLTARILIAWTRSYFSMSELENTDARTYQNVSSINCILSLWSAVSTKRPRGGGSHRECSRWQYHSDVTWSPLRDVTWTPLRDVTWAPSCSHRVSSPVSDPGACRAAVSEHAVSNADAGEVSSNEVPARRPVITEAFTRAGGQFRKFRD